MLYFEFGQDGLAEAHALKAFELGQGAVKVPFECCFVAEHIVELRRKRNVLPQRFHLRLLGFH